ncbi:hypothetical protein PFISCL1PPCAC_24207, partial [Pristionchus fissidentatus]
TQMLLLSVLFVLIPLVLSTDQLVFVQTLFRHGDRTPTGTYPTDPYQEDFWGVPWGELTTTGMKQEFLQGQRLKRLYVDKEQFVSAKYSRYETTIRSCDAPRCIESASAQMAGFYSGSPTHPNDLPDWPSNWTPMPIHTVPHNEDRELEAGTDCKRSDALTVERVLKPSFLDFIASNWKIIADIIMHSGGGVEADFDTLQHIWGAIGIEKGVYNLTLPDWITDELYDGLGAAIEEGTDYVDGGAGFNYPEDTELLRLRSGFLLKEWINNLNSAMSGNGLKYHAYSAHDSTITGLLLTLGAKENVIGKANPGYASTVTCELWKRDDGFYVKFMYSDDAYSEFAAITRFITGCPEYDDFCPISSFLDRSQKYIPQSANECNAA